MGINYTPPLIFGLTPFSLSGLLISVTCLILIFISLFFGKKEIHRIWAFLNLAVGLWGLGAFLIGIINDEILALSVWKFTEISVAFIAVFFFHVIYKLCNLASKKILNFAYTQGIIFSIASIKSNLFFSGTRLVFNSFYYAEPGFLFYTFLPLWLFFVSYGYFILFQTFWHSKGNFRNQLLYFIIGALLGFSGGITNFLPHFKFDLYPYGNFGIPIYCIIVTYAILKHELLDIKIVFKKGLIYSILITSITIIYFIIVILAEKIFRGLIGYRSFPLTIIAATIIAFTFIPLKNKIQHLQQNRAVSKLFYYWTVWNPDI